MSSIRSGGRSAIVRTKVLDAAAELVATRGLQGVTLPEVARRAGVAATSLYRRWGDVGSLLLEMAAERLAQTYPVPDEGSLERDLELWIQRIVLGVNSTEEPVLLRVLVASWDVPPELRLRALAPRFQQIEAMLERSRNRGEKTPSFDDVADLLFAPLYTRALLGLPVDQPLADRLLQRLLQHAT
jgi:AcrR family transcriptional regulator